MCAVCKEERGQCRQWAVGRAARTDENPRVFAHAETQRVKSDQKSSAAGALWDRVGIVEIFETWFFNIPKPSLFGRPNSCSTHYMNILGRGAGVTLIFNFT